MVHGNDIFYHCIFHHDFCHNDTRVHNRNYHCNYNLGNGVVTSIGVLGPERMDYPKIAGALKFIIDELKGMDS